ncbi:MAG: class I SAM-dependent methyltransferase [Pseudomonadota bacterium]
MHRWLLRLLPGALQGPRRRFRAWRARKRFRDQPASRVFETVYREGLWGRPGEDGERFYSGPGSHDARIVEPYAERLERFLRGFDPPPDVCDLGCGDFNVGARIRPACGRLTACDVVPRLIARNREVFADLDVAFEVADLRHDPLPPARVALAREVFQHLCNADIQRALDNIAGRYEWLIVGENVSTSPRYAPNLDQVTGPNNDRLRRASGVDLTAPPFSLTPLERRELLRLEAPEREIAFVTTALRLAA